MENIYLIKGERQTGSNTWKNISWVVKKITLNECKNIRRKRTIIYCLIVLTLISILIGGLLRLSILLWGKEHEILPILIVIGMILVFGSFFLTIILHWITTKLTKSFNVYRTDSTYYKLLKVCHDDKFGKYEECPVLTGDKLRQENFYKKNGFVEKFIDYLNEIFR